jgi:6-phosphogluconolactonase (cycloisomerase 2 family)
MRKSTRAAGAGGLALAATALFAAPAPANASAEAAGTVFVQTDNPAGNTVVAYDRAADGGLRPAGSYPTGGLGGVLEGSVVDHLASQGSLALDRDAGLLYAVNAGSDTITVFGVHGDRLVRLQVIGSGGSFPVSIAVHGNLLYVLNARDGGSVQGYLRVAGTLVQIPSWHRSLGLDPTQVPQFTHTPGQVAFTPDGGTLLVTTKAGSNAIDVFSVGLGGLSATPVVTSLPGAVPFAVSFDAQGHLVLAEAGTNTVATFSVRRDGQLTAITQVPTGQAATCWIAGTGERFYLSNAGSGSVSGFAAHGDGTLTALGNTGTDAGTVDATVTPDGRFLYVETGANGIVDGYRIDADGSLTPTGSATVPGDTGGEGIASS